MSDFGWAMTMVKEGKTVRRKSWSYGRYVRSGAAGLEIWSERGPVITDEDISREDWETIDQSHYIVRRIMGELLTTELDVSGPVRIDEPKDLDNDLLSVSVSFRSNSIWASGDIVVNRYDMSVSESVLEQLKQIAGVE